MTVGFHTRQDYFRMNGKRNRRDLLSWAGKDSMEPYMEIVRWHQPMSIHPTRIEALKKFTSLKLARVPAMPIRWCSRNIISYWDRRRSTWIFAIHVKKKLTVTRTSWI